MPPPQLQPTFPPPPAHSLWVLGLAMLVPIFLLGAGIGLWLWVRRRHFYRTNAAGVEEFPNVRSVVIAGFIEWLALFSGLLLIGAGLVSGLF